MGGLCSQAPGAERRMERGGRGLITYSRPVEKLSEILRNNKDGAKLNSLLARNITIYLLMMLVRSNKNICN